MSSSLRTQRRLQVHGQQADDQQLPLRLERPSCAHMVCENELKQQSHLSQIQQRLHTFHPNLDLVQTQGIQGQVDNRRQQLLAEGLQHRTAGRSSKEQLHQVHRCCTLIDFDPITGAMTEGE
ncbi:hypothetical protein SH501x_001654 [Pirellulaceae bacterium SH501]